MLRQPRSRNQFICPSERRSCEHCFGPLRVRDGGRHGGGGRRRGLGRLQGRGQVHQSLDLNAVTGAHVRNVVEVRGSGNHLRTSVVIPVKQFNQVLSFELLSLIKCLIRFSYYWTHRQDLICVPIVILFSLPCSGYSNSTLQFLDLKMTT